VTATIVNLQSQELRYRVLLIEDDPADIFLVQRALDGLPQYGLNASRLSIAKGAEEAFRMLQEALDAELIPDLIILDLRLPGMDGFRFLEHLKSLEGLDQIPVFVLAGEISKEDSDRLYKLGAADVQTKLYSADELAGLFEKVLPLWLV
jgi:CheY-like chemotaxis protein